MGKQKEPKLIYNLGGHGDLQQVETFNFGADFLDAADI